MGRTADLPGLASAAWQTWGTRGLARRAGYEAARRSGALAVAERRRGSVGAHPAPLRAVGLAAPPSVRAPVALPSTITLYGGLDVGAPVPPDWHRHPLTGHRYPADAHWSALGDADPDAGDIKDTWELSRLGWLHPWLRRWAATGDEDAAETIWTVIEDWHDRNPPYAGPHWMCGQETSLRAIGVMALADALRPSARTTEGRQELVALLVREAVGRVAPTLGYALSQRNNHAVSEAGFLWSATALAPDLPRSARLARRARRALVEAVEDQVAPDGAYAQHSPTYHRLALHVLLWCLAVERATGAPLPDEVHAAVARSVPHLRGLVAPGSDGQVPHLGGDDGALLFDLVPGPIGDLRPVLAHAAAATGQASGLAPGPWDDEAAWFGLARCPAPLVPAVGATTTHALTRGGAHAVVRAGPLAHRPAHADQLHVDVWLDGHAVARDPGSFRYTAPAPWGNALAGEEVHNTPRRAGHPQAVRAGRFFWRRWDEATVELRVDDGAVAAVLARLDLGGTVARRLVAVADGRVVVVDQAGGPLIIRWNLPEGVHPATEAGRTTVRGASWRAELHHGMGARVLVPDPADPTSGWWAPGYGRRGPLTATEVPTDAAGTAVAAFTAGGDDPAPLVAVARHADLATAAVDATALRALWGAMAPDGS